MREARRRLPQRLRLDHAILISNMYSNLANICAETVHWLPIGRIEAGLHAIELIADLLARYLRKTTYPFERRSRPFDWLHIGVLYKNLYEL